jgi:hypothetical protein
MGGPPAAQATPSVQIFGVLAGVGLTGTRHTPGGYQIARQGAGPHLGTAGKGVPINIRCDTNGGVES